MDVNFKVLYLWLLVNEKGFSEIISEIYACHDSVVFNGTHVIWTVVDVTNGAAINMPCHFCNEEDDYLAKIWYRRIVQHNYAVEEINLETSASSTNNIRKINLIPSNTLKLHNFNSNDSGIYFCKYYSKCRNRKIFIYILDSIADVPVKFRKGTFLQWHDYRHSYLDPINNKIKRSRQKLVVTLRNKYNCSIQVITVWDSWGQCSPSSTRQGIRKRIGRCRLELKSMYNSNKSNLALSYILNYGFQFQTPLDVYLSCRSIKINEFLPNFRRMLMYMPDYELEEPCNMRTPYTGTSGNDGITREIIKQVAENSLMTLNCQRAPPDSRILWFKNKKLLNSTFRNNMAKSEEEPHITIDVFNLLHLLHVTKNEEGNYTCVVDGRKIQKYIVKVVSKTMILNQEFIRYSLYLGFVLSLTISCYCAGVCIAWHRRSSFADPLDWNTKSYHQLQGQY